MFGLTFGKQKFWKAIEQIIFCECSFTSVIVRWQYFWPGEPCLTLLNVTSSDFGSSQKFEHGGFCTKK